MPGMNTKPWARNGCAVLPMAGAARNVCTTTGNRWEGKDTEMRLNMMNIEKIRRRYFGYILMSLSGYRAAPLAPVVMGIVGLWPVRAWSAVVALGNASPRQVGRARPLGEIGRMRAPPVQRSVWRRTKWPRGLAVNRDGRSDRPSLRHKQALVGQRLRRAVTHLALMPVSRVFSPLRLRW